MATHSSTLAEKSHGQRSLVGCSPWRCKESDTTEGLHFLSFCVPAGLSRWLSGKESMCLGEVVGLIPRLGRSPGEGNGHPLQFLAWRILVRL